MCRNIDDGEKKNAILPKDMREELFKNLDTLKFLSAPLAGLHDHLATLAHGTHIKPTLRMAGEKLKGIASAINDDAGFTNEVFEAMGTETDLTPYAQLVNFYDFPAAAFKPAVHGQFKFTKINIIDKFGQAIHAIDPRRFPGGPPPLYPRVSDFYARNPNQVTRRWLIRSRLRKMARMSSSKWVLILISLPVSIVRLLRETRQTQI